MEKTRKRRNTGRVTLQEVANFAGVGSMTVSRALRTPEQVSDKLREKIEHAVETLGYIPNRTAGALASGNSDIVAVLIPSLTNKASSRFMQALQSILNKNEFQLLLGCHEYNPSKETEIVMTLLQSNPAAVVVFGSQLMEKTYQLLERGNIPTVNVVGSPFKGAKIAFEAAFFESAYEVTCHILERGYQNIGFIGAHMDNRVQRQQLNGWHKGMLEHYKNADQTVITTTDAASLQFGRYALTEILQSQPYLDAVICSHEEIALGVMFECQRRLLKIPGNMAVACLDGSDNCDQTHPTLTSMRIDYKKMGKEAARMLIELLNNDENDGDDKPRCQMFSYKFEPRHST